eukprot:10460366-Karenia_brevis.AAC.1
MKPAACAQCDAKEMRRDWQEMWVPNQDSQSSKRLVEGWKEKGAGKGVAKESEARQVVAR